MNWKHQWICLLLVSACCTASGTQRVSYWIVGSFASDENAQIEKARVEGLVEAQVTLLPSKDGHHLRLGLDAGQTSQSSLAEAGLSSWLLVLDRPPELQAGKSKSDPGSNPDTPTPELPAAPNPAPVPVPAPAPERERERGPEPGESLAMYCQRLPESRLCQHPLADWALQYEKRVQNGKQALESSCESERNSEARRVCEQWRSSE